MFYPHSQPAASGPSLGELFDLAALVPGSTSQDPEKLLHSLAFQTNNARAAYQLGKADADFRKELSACLLVLVGICISSGVTQAELIELAKAEIAGAATEDGK